MEHVQAELRRFIVDSFLFGQEGDGLLADTSLMGKGIVDSTGVLELITFLEKRYGVQIADEEIVPANLDSISNIARFLERKVSSAAPA